MNARLDLFWSEVWLALWALVRAECDVASVVQARSKTKAEQTETRVRKVARLDRAGETGRALAAARYAPPVPVTRDIVQESTSLYPVDPDPANPSTAQVSHVFIFQIAEFNPLTLKPMLASANRAQWEFVRNTGTTSAPTLGTPTCSNVCRKAKTWIPSPFLPKALSFFKRWCHGFSAFAFASPFVFPSSWLCMWQRLYRISLRGSVIAGFQRSGSMCRSRPWGVHPANDSQAALLLDKLLEAILSCLEDLTVLPEVKNWFLLATCCAAVFQRVRYQVLFFLFFQKRLFKKFSSYPFENHGGGFCNFCLWDSLLAMKRLRGCYRIPERLCFHGSVWCPSLAIPPLGMDGVSLAMTIFFPGVMIHS